MEQIFLFNTFFTEEFMFLHVNSCHIFIWILNFQTFCGKAQLIGTQIDDTHEYVDHMMHNYMNRNWRLNSFCTLGLRPHWYIVSSSNDELFISVLWGINVHCWIWWHFLMKLQVDSPLAAASTQAYWHASIAPLLSRFLSNFTISDHRRILCQRGRGARLCP